MRGSLSMTCEQQQRRIECAQRSMELMRVATHGGRYFMLIYRSTAAAGGEGRSASGGVASHARISVRAILLVQAA